MKFYPVFFLILTGTTTLLDAQQVADTLFNFQIANPLYDAEKGPTIFLDEGHNNFHTSTGRFKPFADFLRKDGYIIKGFDNSFTSNGLKEARIVVIANAINEKNLSHWTLPTPSAFTDEEIYILQKWVQEGGSLFLIADHMPFPGAAEKLASAFGFKFYNGFAMNKNRDSAGDLFTKGQGLYENAITKGRTKNETITTLQTFTGQAFEAPSAANLLVVMDERFEMLLPQTAWNFTENTTRLSAKDLAQGAYLSYGKGRLVVFGEAAMFSAQIQRDTIRMGMNAKTAYQNPQFLLNVIHWLDHQLD